MGLFEFVFGKGAPKDENAPKQAFYLNSDDAKSFGDIEYMRSSKTVKRTFAKKKGQTEHMESVKSISATAATEVGANNSYTQQPQVTFSSVAASAPVAPAPKATPEAPAETVPTASKSTEAAKPASEPAVRRSPSNDMDMFRNMAKSIRK